MRIAKFSTWGVIGVTITVALSGCVGAPGMQVYGDLTERCFATETTPSTSTDGYLAYIGVTLENTSPRDMILREAEPVELVNAEVMSIDIVVTPTAYTTFGVAPGGRLTPPQRPLWNDRLPIDGVRLAAGSTAELIVVVRALDFTKYAGIEGVSVKYDDGWFSATNAGGTVAGFVPPWTTCTTQGH